LSAAEADKLAAMISGMTSLALSASRLLDKGALRQVIIERGAGSCWSRPSATARASGS
jgi:predicted regulator of Ras-like GTPase activity (Roadblock/LC7/MglB family)